MIFTEYEWASCIIGMDLNKRCFPVFWVKKQPSSANEIHGNSCTAILLPFNSSFLLLVTIYYLLFHSYLWIFILALTLPNFIVGSPSRNLAEKNLSYPFPLIQPDWEAARRTSPAQMQCMFLSLMQTYPIHNFYIVTFQLSTPNKGWNTGK